MDRQLVALPRDQCPRGGEGRAVDLELESGRLAFECGVRPVWLQLLGDRLREALGIGHREPYLQVVAWPGGIQALGWRRAKPEVVASPREVGVPVGAVVMLAHLPAECTVRQLALLR